MKDEDEDHRLPGTRSQTSSASETMSKETLLYETTTAAKSRDASLYSSRSQESLSMQDRIGSGGDGFGVGGFTLEALSSSSATGVPLPPPPSQPSHLRAYSVDYASTRKFVYEAYKDVLTESELQVKIADLGNACWTVIRLNLVKFNNYF